MNKRTLAGNVALALYVATLVSVSVSFFSASWVISDKRLPGSKLERFGLWTHCFRSLPHPIDVEEQTVFVGCHWIFDPFTSGYSELKPFLLPPFIMTTQFFYSIAFVGTLIAGFGSVLYVLRWMGNGNKVVAQLTYALSVTLVLSGFCATIAVSVFTTFANQPGWMPGQENNFFGWTFGVAIASCFLLISSGAFYLLETKIQVSIMKSLRQSQIHIDNDIDEI